MIHSKNVKARLFFTYLKDKTELFLYIKPQGTSGSRIIYRRAPGDAAMSLRIEALLENAGILRSDIEIWILLYPPEIHTTTIYIPSELSDLEIASHIRESVLSNQPYAINYDWKNYIMQRRENGHKQEMVTITFLGKNVLPRIRSLLYKDHPKVNFIGDGLQFLNVDNTRTPQVRGETYELFLPYDEIYYKATFRSGIHFESLGLPHGCSSEFGPYKLEPEQVYLKINRNGSKLDLPVFQPLVPKVVWKETLLTPAAFPTWYIALRSMEQHDHVNFAELFHAAKDQEKPAKQKGVTPDHYLD